jgi:glycosyltransferase involved in cell wall biosynthesis
MPTKPPHRLAVFTTHPIQYQCPLWRRLNDDQGITTRVFFLSDFSARAYHDEQFGRAVEWTVPLLEGFEYEVLQHEPPTWRTVGSRSLARRLSAFSPDACLLTGYVPLYYWHAILACRMLGVPAILRTEATDADKRRPPILAAGRSLALRAFYGQISSFLAIGHNARNHYLRLGVKPERIGMSPYCIDTPLFERQRLAAVRGPMRREIGIPDDALVVLFSGKLIPKKDPGLVLAALERVQDIDGRPVHVVFMGDGELRIELEQRAERVGKERMHFLGFRNQDEMGEVYANSDMLVLPSRFSETWGLVVNEAMQFGIPALVSDRVGCGPDLVEAGRTGWIFPEGDAIALGERIVATGRQLSEDRQAVYAACRAKADAYSLERAMEGIRDAVGRVASRGA